MIRIKNKNILLGITGGIAAYKAAELVRLLVRAEACVRVVMTEAAQQFIAPLTLQALSAQPVHTDLLDPEAEAGMGHIELAKWADLILVAPASADFLARLVHGHANDLLTTLCLASEAPVAVAPAMNQVMWRNLATQSNLALLVERGVVVMGPAEGQQACGDIGPGRMLEPTELAQKTAEMFAGRRLLEKKVVVTAGPTREAIDPVRYLSNYSSGKMGYALAQAFAEEGAEVILISGPCQLSTPAFVQRVDIESADEMLAASLKAVVGAHIFVGAAAVADFRVATVEPQKIKKGASGELALTLVKNPDIVATVANLPERPFTVGFAAESQRILEYARDKLKSKNLDLVLANDISCQGIGFNSDDNAITLVSASEEKAFPRNRKTQLARDLVADIIERFEKL